jgi:hypothetical protein
VGAFSVNSWWDDYPRSHIPSEACAPLLDHDTRGGRVVVALRIVPPSPEP